MAAWSPRNPRRGFATADAVTGAEAAALARDLARYRIATAAQMMSLGDETRTDPGLMALLRISDAAQIDPMVVWRPRNDRERLRVPIGVTPDGTPVEIDIKVSAESGMGPHGLCIGATGSGKSEFLRTLVLSLVATHSPDLVNLVLVDFKGGATFLGLEGIRLFEVRCRIELLLLNSKECKVRDFRTAGGLASD